MAAAPAPQHTESFPKDLRLLSSHHMPEPPPTFSPSAHHPTPYPTPPCHRCTPHTIPPRDSSHIPGHSSITTKQYTLQSCSKCPRLFPIQHNRSNACFIYLSTMVQQNTPVNQQANYFLPLSHAAPTLALIALSEPPPHSNTSSR